MPKIGINSKSARILPEGFYKYISGVRKTVGAKADTGLYSRAKPVMQALFGSVCRAHEIYYSTLILLAENPANLCYTGGNRLDIGKIAIERNLRPRRTLKVDAEANYYDSRVGEWKLIDVAPDRLNTHGHVSGCGCMLCRGVKVKPKKSEQASPKRE